MFTRRWLVWGIFAAGLAPAQEALTSVQVTGAVKQELRLSADDLAKMPRASVQMMNNGTETVYEGVWLHEVLKRAGVPLASELRGKALASYLLAQAQDGYQVVFSLLVADTTNGKPLSGPQGRFRLVVPKDKPAARSIRMLTKLEVVQLRK
jgi:DMSO/TMAO reductase YedYZ molybdopterin-dependent catalytic subunit